MLLIDEIYELKQIIVSGIVRWPTNLIAYGVGYDNAMK